VGSRVLGSEVLGSGFLVILHIREKIRVILILLILLVGNQVINETSNSSTGASCMVIHILKLIIPDVLLIQSHVKFTLNFGARSFCISKKADKLRV
jgi:hypothetical protein